MMNNRTQTLARWLFLLLLAVPGTLRAQSFGGGSGTETDPYIITTVEHMNQLASAVNNGTSYIFKYFRMDADIDFAGASFKGIGEQNNNAPSGFNMFEGCFDGNGHTIRGMRSTYSTNYHGLFNIIGAIATIKNLTMVDCVIQGGANVGAIAGYMNGTYADTGHGVRDCKVAEDVRVTGTTSVGGIVGSTQGSSDIYGCTFLGTVSGNDWVGAITGHSWTHYVYVKHGNTNVDPDQQSKACYIGGNCTKGAVGTDGTDGTDEHTSAKHITSVTFADNINGRFGTTPIFNFNGKNYYQCGSTINLSLSYSGTPPTGYIVDSFLANGNSITKTANGYTVTLPSLVTNVHITASQAVRDIGYEPWITITTPSQEWTGSTLTPVVTVIDNKSGSPVTLQQGTDYRLSPEGGFGSFGSHDITVIGMGNYGGQATTVFNITNPSFDEGSGTETAPYIIRTVEEMEKLAVCVINGVDMNGIYFRLGNNLDYTGKTMKPIGDYDRPFCGTFDGCYYTVSNINYTCSNNESLFAHLGTNGTVRYLIIDNSTINCNNNNNIGGIVARCNGGTIENCKVTKDVNIINGNMSIGGIVGLFVSGTIEYCTNEATVSGSQRIGGIVGSIEDAGNKAINECFNYGNITASYSRCGGIAGSAQNVSIFGCINEGNVAGHLNVGGIAGTAVSSTISDNLNLGGVTANGNAGGILGAPTIENDYTLRNNYYAGNCTTGGIRGSDVMGQAMKGWIVSADEENLFAQPWPIDEETGAFVGIAYDGNYYAGAGETTKLLIDRLDGAPEGTISVSAGTLTPLDEEYYGRTDVFYLLTMPTEGQDVNIFIDTSATAISTIDQDERQTMDGKWYTIDGQHLQGKPVKKGIYICNGKKVVVK